MQPTTRSAQRALDTSRDIPGVVTPSPAGQHIGASAAAKSRAAAGPAAGDTSSSSSAGKKRGAAALDDDGESGGSGSAAGSPPKKPKTKGDTPNGEYTLATVRSERKIDHEGDNVTLRADLEVHTDPVENLTCRLGYHVTLSLVGIGPPGKGKAKAKGGGKDVTKIGDIYSWRIDRPTSDTKRPSTSKAELLDPDTDTFDDGDAKETARAMKAIYFKNRKLRPAFRARTTELLRNRLIFVAMVHIYDEFQQKGLLRPTLEAFEECLAHRDLPEWYLFDQGTLILVPARPDGDQGDSWGDMSDDDVEEILIRAYTNHGDYEVWGENVIGGDSKLTVMGKVIGNVVTDRRSGYGSDGQDVDAALRLIEAVESAAASDGDADDEGEEDEEEEDDSEEEEE